MTMNSKLALPVVCVFALLGGVFGGWLFSNGENPNPTFESVTVTKDLIVASPDNMDSETGAGCRLRPDGTLTVTKGLLANQIRGQVIAAQSVLASANPLHASFDEQQIMAQMTADPKSGGKFVALNLDATLVPVRGASPKGSATCIRFHPENGRPEIFTHDLTLGEQGKSFMLSHNAKPAPGPAQGKPQSELASRPTGLSESVSPPSSTSEANGLRR